MNVVIEDAKVYNSTLEAEVPITEDVAQYLANLQIIDSNSPTV